MALDPGDGPQKESVKPWPLQEVVFKEPTKIEGLSIMLTTLEAGVNRLVDGKEWSPPAMWYDPANRLISISGFVYPLERVHRFRRAKMAITKKPPPIDTSKYTIGKRKNA